MSFSAPESSASSELMAFRRDPLAFLMRAAGEGGDLIPLNLGMGETYLVNHPDLVREVLLAPETNFEPWFGTNALPQLLASGLLVGHGDGHRKMRRMAQPAFHRQRIEGYATIMTELADRMRNRWREGVEIDLPSEFGGLTMSIVARALFSVDLSVETQTVYDALTELQILFQRTIIPQAEQEYYDRARHQLDQTIGRIIQERRVKGSNSYDDLLSMLLDSDAGLTDEQLRGEIMTIFIAGQETTAVLLMWTFYLLSRHRDEEENLVGEFNRVLGSRLPRTSDVPQLTRASMVLAEVMRLYPPVWTLGRKAIQASQVGKFSLGAGALLVLSPYISHRDPRFFPDPERFDPNRWSEEQKAARPRFSYYPFSGGSRQCLGENFALMEGVLLLATIMQKWQLLISPDHPIQLQPIITLRSKFGMPVKPVCR
jgi:cytochrome P450